MPKDFDVKLTIDELKSMRDVFPSSQLPLIYTFRSNVRYDKITRPNSAIALSIHYIGVFTKEDEKDTTFNLIALIHIRDIDSIYFSHEPMVLVQTKGENGKKIIANSKEHTLKFTQLLYVISAITFSYFDHQISFKSNTPEKFPPIEFNQENRNSFPVPLSFSQQFQFAYYANCAFYNLPYNHEVVRYINAMMLSANSIIDITQLPIDLIDVQARRIEMPIIKPKKQEEDNQDDKKGKKNKKDKKGKKQKKEENEEPQPEKVKDVSDLDPIFNSLNCLNFTNGICCRNLNRPDILQSLEKLISAGRSVKIIHLENCGVTDGLESLSQVIKFNPELEILYWNLSNNKFNDFKSFSTIITYSKGELLYLNLSNCNIKASESRELFVSLWRNPLMHKIRFLFLAGMEIEDTEMFSKYLTRNISITTLDLSSIQDNSGKLISILREKKYPLQVLIIRNIDLPTCFDELLDFLKSTETLNSLDISGTGITPYQVADVITTIAKNIIDRRKEHNVDINSKDVDITPFTFNLFLNNLNLHDTAILLLYRSFLEYDLNIWRSLSFDENEMNEADLKYILSLFLRMRSLESLSLNGNFDSEMGNVHLFLPRLIDVPKLSALSIAGNETHKLGKVLESFLEKVRTTNKLEYLDVRNNSGGDNNYLLFVQIIHSCSKLKRFFIDGSDLKCAEDYEKIVNALEMNKTLISMPFPLIDAQNIVNQARKVIKEIPPEPEPEKKKGKKKDKKMEEMPIIKEELITPEELIKFLGELQMSTVTAINANRTRLKLPNDLPFPANEEIEVMIEQISHSTREYIRRFIPKKHSLITGLFRLPLPFQKIGEDPHNGGKIQKVDIGPLETYEIEGMDEIIIEEKKTYQTCICPTMFLQTLKMEPVTKDDSDEKWKKRGKYYGSEDESSDDNHNYSNSDDSSDDKRGIKHRNTDDDSSDDRKRRKRKHSDDDDSSNRRKQKTGKRCNSDDDRRDSSDSDEKKKRTKRKKWSESDSFSDDKKSKTSKNRKSKYISSESSDEMPIKIKTKSRRHPQPASNIVFPTNIPMMNSSSSDDSDDYQKPRRNTNRNRNKGNRTDKPWERKNKRPNAFDSDSFEEKKPSSKRKKSQSDDFDDDYDRGYKRTGKSRRRYYD